MKKLRLRSDWILKILSICVSFIFPIMVWIFLSGDVYIKIFNYVWIALYSCIFVCLIYKNMVLKVFICILNFLSVAFITFLFLMSDGDLIIKVIVKAIFPFFQISSFDQHWSACNIC
ncbi:hypothetical protein C818_04142 [Lachnospiraceae bacterium MD308]|nr:hypothetical protein C818_04142 [Lachnospiraceae bacterium MD308]